MGVVDDAGADSIVCHQRFGLALLAQAALMPKLVDVYRDLLTYSGSGCELYVLGMSQDKKAPGISRTAWESAFVGKKFSVVGNLLREVSAPENPIILIGILRRGEVMLSPKQDPKLQANDKLIVLAWSFPYVHNMDIAARQGSESTSTT